MAEALGRKPTDDELALSSNICRKDLDRLKLPCQIDRIAKGFDDVNFKKGIMTFKKILTKEADYDYVGDANFVFHMLMKSLGRFPIEQEFLSDEERTFLAARFGLEGLQAMSLEQVAVEFGVPVEEMRRFEELILVKLNRVIQESMNG